MTTLVVETGTGVLNANTYVSETDAVTYIRTFTPFANDFASWVDDTPGDENLRLALIQATKAIDEQYGARYQGVLASNTQPLLYPRTGFYDVFGRYRAENTIPTALKDAVCELAIMIYDGTDPYAAVNNEAYITSKSTSIDGAIATDVSYSKPVKGTETFVGHRRVEKVLLPILMASTKITGIRL